MHDLLRAARRDLAHAGVDPGDAIRLARDLLPQHAPGTVLELVDDAPAAFEAAFRAAVARRARREPLQLIVGRVDFRGTPLATRAGVFIPRFETEVVAGVAIDAARAVVMGAGRARVADLCTGSGAIAAAVAREVPAARVWAVEVDDAAAALAAENLAGLAVTLEVSDVAGALAGLDGTFDVVVSNPPYVPPDGVPRDPEVLHWDPPLALYGGGADGLDVPREVMRAAGRLLRPGGVLVMEHADVQGPAVRAALARFGTFAGIETLPDLTGRDRMVRATRLAAAPGMGDWQA